MKIFGWKSAGREESRPALSRYAPGGGQIMGDWPASYDAQLREGYARNVIAQRSVRLVAQGLGGVPLLASSPAILALLTARSGGQVLAETVAAQLLLHGILNWGWTALAWSRWRCAAAVLMLWCRRAMGCAAATGRWSARCCAKQV